MNAVSPKRMNATTAKDAPSLPIGFASPVSVVTTRFFSQDSFPKKG